MGLFLLKQHFGRNAEKKQTQGPRETPSKQSTPPEGGSGAVAHPQSHGLLSRTLLTVALFHERERARLNSFPLQAETQRKGKRERKRERERERAKEGGSRPTENEMNTTS